MNKNNQWNWEMITEKKVKENWEMWRKLNNGNINETVCTYNGNYSMLHCPQYKLKKKFWKSTGSRSENIWPERRASAPLKKP